MSEATSIEDGTSSVLDAEAPAANAESLSTADQETWYEDHQADIQAAQAQAAQDAVVQQNWMALSISDLQAQVEALNAQVGSLNQLLLSQGQGRTAQAPAGADETTADDVPAAATP